MRRRNRLTLILAAALAIGAGAIYSHVGSGSHVNVDRLVTRALSRNVGVDYIAHVVTTTQYGGKTIRTQATVFHQGEAEKVEYAGASGRSVWSMTKGGKSYTYLPKESKLLVSETSRLLSDTERSALLLKNYRVIDVGTDRVAGRDAYVVKISSRYEGRPSKKLWMDRRRLTILKSVDYSASGDERGSTETSGIRYDAKIPPGTFAVPTGSSVSVIRVCESAKSADLFKTLGMQVHQPKYLPAGYEPEGYHLFNSQCNCNHRSAQLTYTDGLNVISVFQTPAMACCKDGTCNMADCGSDKGCAVANCDVAKTGVISRGDRTVVVVGDLLPADVKRIAESVE